MPAPLFLDSDDFARSFDLAPRLAVCLLVRDAAGGVLLARRGAGMAMAGVWHLPGAFLLRNETLAACAERVARKELGRGIVGQGRLFGAYDDLEGDPRGHVVDLVFEVTLDGRPMETAETGGIAFFREVPEGLGFGHDRVLRAALGRVPAEGLSYGHGGFGAGDDRIRSGGLEPSGGSGASGSVGGDRAGEGGKAEGR